MLPSAFLAIIAALPIPILAIALATLLNAVGAF